ncbi:hypothetical protein AURDEDRAFT_129829 [Auricularia subglabra TFB-10046 SS5]|nr:hypothetical protein AURDEDRAFT_129829 [Auricularia subglabra TFB-10046 SS5]
MAARNEESAAPGLLRGRGTGAIARGIGLGRAPGLSRRDGDLSSGHGFAPSGRDGDRGRTGGDEGRGRETLLPGVEPAAKGEDDVTSERQRLRPIQPPPALRLPPHSFSRPLFLHPFPPPSAPFRTPGPALRIPAPFSFPPPVAQPPAPRVGADAAPIPPPPAAVLPAPTPAPPAIPPAPKVALSVDSAASVAPTTSGTNPGSSSASADADASSASPSLLATSDGTASPSSTSSPIASGDIIVASSFASPGTSSLLPATNTSGVGVGVGGKVAAACVIGAVLLLLVNWAFWLMIRRRRARRSVPAHWDFAAPPPSMDGHEDPFAHSEDEPARAKADKKDTMVTIPV